MTITMTMTVRVEWSSYNRIWFSGPYKQEILVRVERWTWQLGCHCMC
jgi:hypothetical protein